MTRPDHKQNSALRSLRSSLSKRPDLLFAIAKRHSTNPLLHPPPSPLSASNAAPATSAALRISIPQGSPTYDALGVTLKTKQREVQVDIPLRHTAKTPKEVRQSIKQMGEDALAYYGIPESPQVTSYNSPRPFSIIPFLVMVLLLFVAYAPASNHYANVGRSLVERYAGPNAIQYSLFFFGWTHLAMEPMLLLRRLLQYRVPFHLSLLYLATVLAIGLGGIDALERAVIQERIRLLRSASPIDAKDRALQGADEVVDEQEFEQHGIPKSPKVTHYNPPPFPSTLVIPPLILLLFLQYAPSSFHYANVGRKVVERYLGPNAMGYFVLFAGACHLVVEPLVMLRKLIKHRVPFLPSLSYMSTVILIGFGGFQAFNRAVYQERIRLLRAAPKKNQ
ncbi:hypothetical protein IAR50_006975 [Cryptococcus sp. DSM 104548]